MKRNSTNEKGGIENDGGGNDGKNRKSDTPTSSNTSNEEKTDKKSLLNATKEPIRRVQSAAEVASTNNTDLASTSASAIASDVNDFFARARAMGLNLTRQDYERARAGVSAFLRAERVAKPANLTTTTSNSGSPESNDVQNATVKNAKTITAAEQNSSNSLSTSRFHRSVSTGGQPTLSFFTAVLPTQDPNAKLRPRLDDISSLEERRRRREKRRRLREKSEREANDADCESGSHGRRKKAASEPIEDSPSTGVGAYDSPLMTVDQSPRSRALRSKIASMDLKTFSSVGLGILGQGSTGMALSQNEDEHLKGTHLTLHEKLQSPEVSKLSRKAHIDETGKLVLLPSPIKDRARSNEEIVTCTSGFDDMSANAGGETDDSGICVNNEAVSNPSKKPSEPNPSSPRRRRLSSFSSLSNNDLNERLDNLSFLDRIMAQKKSPLRLRKEAKARERKERLLAANNDLIVMTAMSKQGPVQTSSSVMPAPLTAASAISSQSTASSSQASSSGNDGKSVRWASDFHLSPRKRMTTKEMYDFEFYGIAPTQAPLHGMASWDNGEAEVLRRLQNSSTNDDSTGMMDEFGHSHSRLRSQMNSTMFGSPVGSRTAQSIVPHSPGMLSLAFHDSALQSAALLAKRGLLFGSTTPGGSSTMVVTPPVPSAHEGLGQDLHNVFSQGPTLAQSPARKGLIETETPPRLIRAKTLAAPISLAQSVFGKEDRSNTAQKDPSPQRMSLMRAHSSSVIPDRSAQRQNAEVDKENQGSQVKKKVPAGWVSHSPGGRLDTISPAAIFGFGQDQLSQSKRNQSQPKNARVLQESKKHNSQQSEQNQRQRMASSGSISDSSRTNGQYSASDIEGDDEHDLSPTVQMHGKRAQANAAAFAARMKKKANQDGHDRNSSMSASSAYDDSPLVLDTRSSKATVIARPSSGTSLARALDLPNRAERSKTDTIEGLRTGNNTATMEWDKPDGSRVVKLVSEELQAALESGSLPVEPPARFYKLPAGWGQSKTKPQSVSYAGMIGQAILSSSDSRLSLNEIYNWIATVFPFFERGDRGWQNSIRHNLSLNKSFEKVERAANVPGKGGWWAIKPGHEDRFRNGNYYAPGTVKASKDNGVKTPKTTSAALPSSGNADDENESSSQKANHSGKVARRKRVESERTEGSGMTEGSDSDVALSSIQAKKHTSKDSRKRLKKGSRTSLVNEENTGPDGQQGGMNERAIPVTLLKPNQESASNRFSPSPKQYNTITPSRPYQPRMMGTSSSDIGSVYASSVMAGMPVLTDASSPPSSPNHAMPPPPGGVRGAASTQSAQKQKEALMQQYHQQGIQMGYNLQGGNMYSHHYMPASPLAHMRGSSNNGASMGQLAASNNQGNGRFNSNVESPLRHSTSANTSNNLLDASASRFAINSAPVSNVRDTTNSEDNQQENEHDKLMLSTNSIPNSQHSPARFLNHSPLRGSPLRPGGSLGQQSNANSSNSLLSPAGMHLQMATNGNNNGNLNVASTPMMQRWGMTSPFSSRLFSPSGYLTPNTHGHLTGNGATNQTPGLEDPFDYSGSLQHELDMASELHHLTSTIQGDPSPTKGFDQNTFMHRTQFPQQQQQQQNNAITHSVHSVSSTQDLHDPNSHFHFS